MRMMIGLSAWMVAFAVAGTAGAADPAAGTTKAVEVKPAAAATTAAKATPAAAAEGKTIWVTDGNALPAAPAGSEWTWTGKNSETLPPKKEYELRPVSAAAAPVTSSNLKVEAKLCKSIAARECVDPTDTFSVADGSAAAWLKVTGGANSEIHAVWFFGDAQTDDITLKIGGSPWRTNSKKTLHETTKGDWRVEVRDANGGVLETLKFKVQ